MLFQRTRAPVLISRADRRPSVAPALSRACAPTIAGAVAMLALVPLARAQTAVRAQSAAAFLDTIGINTHMGTPQVANGTDYDDVSAISGELSAVGIQHLRDSLFIGGALGNLVQLHAMTGATVDFVHDNYATTASTADLQNAVANIATEPAIVEGFEGANEPDWFGAYLDGQSGAPAVVAIQNALHAAVRSVPSFSGVPINCPALSYSGAGGLGAQLGNLAGVCDTATSHDYVENTALGTFLPYQYIQTWSPLPEVWAPGRPPVITEGGWTSNPSSSDGVDETVQAKLTLDYLFDSDALGVTRTYLYELADDAPDPTGADDEDHYGLFRADGTAKPAATAIGNLHAILAGGSAAATGSLSYAVSGLPTNGHQLLLEKSPTEYVVVLWQEGTLWNASSHAEQTLAPAGVTLTLGQPASAVSVYDPTIATTPMSTATGTSSLPIAIPDHPVLVDVALQ